LLCYFCLYFIFTLPFGLGTLDDVVAKAEEFKHFESKNASFKIEGEIKSMLSESEYCSFGKLKTMLGKLERKNPNGFHCQRGTETNHFITEENLLELNQIQYAPRLGSIHTTVDYNLESENYGLCGYLDDFWDKFSYLNDVEKSPVELNPKLYLIWKFYQYVTSHHQDTHIPPHYTVYNQISGYSVFHNLPLLIGLFVTHVAQHRPTNELHALLQEINSRGIGSFNELGPGDVLLVTPFGSHGVCVPTVDENDNLNAHLGKSEVSLVRATELYIKPILQRVRPSLMRDLTWREIPGQYTKLNDSK